MSPAKTAETINLPFGKVQGLSAVSCAKTAEPINAVWDAKWFGPKEASIRWDAHWRNLANTNEPSICGGDAAFLSITLTMF